MQCVCAIAMEVLDEHGNYGTVVRFTSNEWDAFQTFMGGYTDGDNDE